MQARGLAVNRNFVLMKWEKLESAVQLDEINKLSYTLPVMLFKHSTRCSISAMALNRIESKWTEKDSGQLTPYFLDLLNHRDISANIAERYKIKHESPQLLVIKNGECIYFESHNGIRYEDIFKG